MLTLDRRAAPGSLATETLTLACEARRKSRVKVTLDGGDEAGVFLPWGESLHDGDLLASGDGRVVRIVAAEEPVMLVRCGDTRELARAAYHLGNRHIPVEVGEGMLKLAPDPVLRDMLEGLGAKVELAMLPFEPESGAYGAHGHATVPGTLASRIAGPGGGS